MYICICNAVNDRQIREAMGEGKLSIRELRTHFGFKSCCGKCTCYMRALLNEHLQLNTTLLQEESRQAG